MIVDPVIIVGAPRSGTSMLFHILRTSQSFWSLPSEGFHIWNILCHPSLHDWTSEEYYPTQEYEKVRYIINKLYEEQIMPSWFWKRVDHSSIWKFNKSRVQKTGRKLKGNLYINISKALFYLNPARKYIRRRLLDKSLNNCLRLDLVDKVFPGAKYIYIKRDGLQSIQSIINGWLNPHRFYTFYPPGMIDIEGYSGNGWKFVLPEGWQQFKNRHITEVCTWQWITCHEKIMDFKSRNPEKFIDIKLESVVSEPENEFRKISDFINVSQEKFKIFQDSGIPVVNDTPSNNKQNFPFPDRIEEITKQIKPVMDKLGYD